MGLRINRIILFLSYILFVTSLSFCLLMLQMYMYIFGNVRVHPRPGVISRFDEAPGRRWGQDASGAHGPGDHGAWRWGLGTGGNLADRCEVAPIAIT